LGWFVIKLHQNQMLNGGMEIVDSWVKEGKLNGRSIPAAIGEAKTEFAKSKNWKQRFFSYKSLHGILMTLSWFNIFGRIMATTKNDEFTCYTYPVYKPVNASIYRTKGMNLEGMPLKLVPHDDVRERPVVWKTVPGAELGWMAMLFATPVVLSLIVGIIFSCIAEKREVRQVALKKEEEGTQLSAQLSEGGTPLTGVAVGA